MTGPGDAAGAGHGRLRAGHADREQVIEGLKAAFVDGRLTKDELAARTGRALAARTYADLAALTGDIPAEPFPGLPASAAPAVPAPAEPAVAGAAPAVPTGSPAPAIRRPMARAAAISGACLTVAAAAMTFAFYLDPESGPPGPSPDRAWVGSLVLLAFIAVMAALLALGLGVATSIEQRRSRRQLPPRPGPGDRARGGEQRGGTGHDPVPPGHRADETQTDLRAHDSRQRGRRIPARAGRAPGGVRPVPGAA